jgi:hypothetical protein
MPELLTAEGSSKAAEIIQKLCAESRYEGH